MPTMLKTDNSTQPQSAAQAPAVPSAKTKSSHGDKATTAKGGTGRRKRAVAQVRITSGSGKVVINKVEKVLPDYVLEPLKLVGETNKWDISILVAGGGYASQPMAIRLGLARALIDLNPDFKPTLKHAGFLTRDARERERKKYGLKSARRAPQFAKR